MRNSLIHAIDTKRALTFTYDGLQRFVEPHAFGETSKGKLVLRGFQPDGETQRGLGWKLFSLEKIADLILADHFVGPRDGYKPGDKQMARIFAELSLASA